MTPGITALGLDHTSLLGNSISEIAWHKAGILKAGVTTYLDPGQPVTALEVVQDRAREREAVEDWITTADQFHVMRDGPFHTTFILAGLWGGNNYHNFVKALVVRDRLFNVRLDQVKFYDQNKLRKLVWPVIR